MTEFVRVKNKETGAIASLPLAALPMFFQWEQDDGPPPDKPKPKKNLPPAVPAASNEKEQP